MHRLFIAAVLGGAAFSSTVLHAQTLGGASGPAGDSMQVEKCATPKGTLAVAEPQSHILSALRGYGLGSPASMIRLIVQQSNCFQLVERGVGFQNMMQERQLAASGEMQADQNIGKGQLVAADFVLTPAVVFSNQNAGGAGGGLAGLLGGRGLALAAIAGSVKFKEAQTSMLVADARSGIQVAAAEGSAQKTDFNIGGLLFGGGVAAGLGGYTNTAEGKIIAASFLDNFNKIVLAIRDNPSLIAARASGASQANATGSAKANAGAAGDVLVPKIAGVKVYRGANEGAELQTLARSDELIFEGEQQDGFLKVTTTKGSGWVKAILVRKQ